LPLARIRQVAVNHAESPISANEFQPASINVTGL
jgi:hypothetical protein